MAVKKVRLTPVQKEITLFLSTVVIYIVGITQAIVFLPPTADFLNGQRPLFEPCRLLSSCKAWRWGMAATTRRKTRFPTGVTDNPQKGEADNRRHGFLYLYQPITEVANNGLTPQLTPRKQQLLQSCQRCVPTASYNVLIHSKIGLPPLGEGLGEGLVVGLGLRK